MRLSILNILLCHYVSLTLRLTLYPLDTIVVLIRLLADEIIDIGNVFRHQDLQIFFSINPFKAEFTIVIFIHYKPWIAVAILDL